jgi:hypothetical protein
MFRMRASGRECASSHGVTAEDVTAIVAPVNRENR